MIKLEQLQRGQGLPFTVAKFWKAVFGTGSRMVSLVFGPSLAQQFPDMEIIETLDEQAEHSQEDIGRLHHCRINLSATFVPNAETAMDR